MRVALKPQALLLILSVLVLGRCNCAPDTGDDDGGEQTDGSTPGGDGGGAPDGGDPALCTEGLSAIRIDPASPSHPVGRPPQDLQLTALGSFPTGERDISTRVTWSVTRDDDSAPGTIDGSGRYSPEPGLGGRVTVTATAPCAQGSAQVTLQLEQFEQGADAGDTTAFTGTVVTTGPSVPVWVYPSNATRFPRNVYKTLFQWRTAGNQRFRLTFAGPYSTAVVYTDGAHPLCAGKTPAAGCWEADAEIWNAIAGSNAGGEVTVTLDAVTTANANVSRAEPISLGFSRRDVRGAIFYWSTTAAGVRRATVSEAQPQAYVVAKPTATVLAAPGSAVKCVACHTVSRSGRKMLGYTETVSTGKGIFVYDVTLQPPPTVRLTTELTTRKGFGTFSPDDARIVATVDDALKEFNAETGAPLATVVAVGTNPDWSPRGTQLAYSDRGGDSPGSANLKVVSYDGGWGSSSILVPAAGLTNLFPSYTHDGEYLAYARGRGGHGDTTLQLWLAHADNAIAPVELINANRVVNNAVTDGKFENNMPTWAPEGDLEWVAFNSLRPYGVVFPTGGTQQIWVAAVDRSKLDGGVVDPSYPAFRFAFQDLNENNHRAYWAEDVRVPTGDGGVCTAVGAACDPGASTCCINTECIPVSEFTYTCQVALPGNDGGSCLSDGTACDQTSGSPCCGSSICDDDGTGTTKCIAPVTCPGAGATCSTTEACCAGLQCLGTNAQACTGATACTCEVIFGKPGQ